MLLKEYKKEYKDYFMFIDVHHSMIKVSVHNYKDDDFHYRKDFIDYSVKEVYEILCHRISEGVINNEIFLWSRHWKSI